MLYAFSKIFWNLVQPGNLLVLLLALGVVGLWLRRRRARLFVSAVTLAFVAVLVFPVGGWAILPLEERFPQPLLPSRIDGIVLLGGAINIGTTQAHGQAALNRFAERITASAALARQFPEAKLLISGGDPRIAPGELSEADITRSLLLSLGLDDSRMLLEKRSRNTYENAVYSKAMAQPQPGQVWLLVTSAFHMPRAVGCFRAAGFDTLPYPVDYQTADLPAIGFSFASELELFELAVHEWVGLVSYRILGRIDSLFPGPAPTSSSTAR